MTYKEQVIKQRELRDDIRRKNLETLVAKFGGVTALAIAVSRSPQQINNMLNGRKSFGDNITRYIENALDLDNGYLDKSIGEGNIEKTEMPQRRVPLISYVQAGQLTPIGDLVADECVLCYGDAGPSAFALRVKGDSMTPVFDDGDIVIVDDRKAPTVGSYVVARSDLEAFPEATIKKYYVVGYDEHGREIFELRPLNSAYPTMNSQQLKLSIVGVVVEAIKRF